MWVSSKYQKASSNLGVLVKKMLCDTLLLLLLSPNNVSVSTFRHSMVWEWLTDEIRLEASLPGFQTLTPMCCWHAFYAVYLDEYWWHSTDYRIRGLGHRHYGLRLPVNSPAFVIIAYTIIGRYSCSNVVEVARSLKVLQWVVWGVYACHFILSVDEVAALAGGNFRHLKRPLGGQFCCCRVLLGHPSCALQQITVQFQRDINDFSFLHCLTLVAIVLTLVS